MRKTALIVALLTSAVSAQSSILETAAKDGRFKTLVAALGASTAIETLKGDGPFTVFAPTDDAFAKLPDGAVKGLLKKQNRSALDNVLTYHVAAGSFSAADVVVRRGLEMANGQRLPISVHGKTVRVGGAKVILTDIVCSNGIVHVIDSVLMPETRTLPELASRGRPFQTLVAAVKAAGLLDALGGKGPFTILAPTDQAFAALPKGTVETLLKPENRAKLQSILKYHVIPGRVSAAGAIAAGQAATLQGAEVGFEIDGGQLRVQGADVTMTDVNASNGVIHVIDRVLMPPTPARPKGRLVIGVNLDQPSPALAAQLHIDRKKTLIIDGVTKGSGAEAAGLKRYDIIAAVAGKPATHEAIDQAKEQAGYRGTVVLDIIRAGKRMQVPVEIRVAGE